MDLPVEVLVLEDCICNVAEMRGCQALYRAAGRLWSCPIFCAGLFLFCSKFHFLCKARLWHLFLVGPAVESAGRPAGAQRIVVADAVATSQRRGHQSRNLIAGIGSAWRIARSCLSVVRLDRALSTPIRCSHHADLGLRSLGPTVRRGLHHQRSCRTAPRTAALKCGL